MKISQKYVAAFSVGLLIALSCTILGAQAPPEKFLLLKNGSLVRGQIEKDDAGFLVRSARGSTYRIPAQQASQLLNSMEQVFDVKFSKAKRRNRTESYRQLVYWAVNEQLYDSAKQVVAIMAADRSKKSIAEQLNRYIVDTMNRKRSKPATNSVSWKSEPVNQPARKVISAKPISNRTNDNRPSIKELDKLTKSLPPGSMKVFRRLQVKTPKPQNPKTPKWYYWIEFSIFL